MTEPLFYRDVSDELCQGDVFERVPLLYMTEMPQVLKQVDLNLKGELLEPSAPLDPLHPPGIANGLHVNASCDFTRAVLLTYDCEIDKPSTKQLTLAMVRPLDPSMSFQSRQIIRENRKMSTLYLPADGNNLSESLVDFIRISVVFKEGLQAAPRLTRLSDQARQAMLFQLIRFFCRVDLAPK